MEIRTTYIYANIILILSRFSILLNSIWINETNIYVAIWSMIDLIDNTCYQSTYVKIICLLFFYPFNCVTWWTGYQYCFFAVRSGWRHYWHEHEHEQRHGPSSRLVLFIRTDVNHHKSLSWSLSSSFTWHTHLDLLRDLSTYKSTHTGYHNYITLNGHLTLYN